MRARLLPLLGAVAGAVLVGFLGIALGWNPAAIAVAAVIGLVAGAASGQALAWLRDVAGRTSRLEAKVASQEADQRAAIGKVAESVKQVGDAAAAARAASQAETAAAINESTKESAKAILDLRHRVEELFKRQSTERRQVRSLVNQQVKQQAALLGAFGQLQRLVPMPLPMPLPGAWAGSEDYLLLLAGEVLERRPHLVVDLGSGQSSVWMAGAMRAAGYGGKVVAFDHEEAYARATRELGERQGVTPWLEVRYAPLCEQVVDGRTVHWYDPDGFADLQGIGLLSVDGPPAADTEWARWPALPLLRDRLAANARAVVDDLVREDEQQMVADWLERYPEFSATFFDFEKGAAVLSRT